MKKIARYEEIHSISNNKRTWECDLFHTRDGRIDLMCADADVDTGTYRDQAALPVPPNGKFSWGSNSPSAPPPDPNRVIGANQVPEIRIRLKNA